MWYYAENSEQRGPVTKEALIAKLQSGELTRDTLVWTNNMRNWEKACDVREISEALPPAPTDFASAQTLTASGIQQQNADNPQQPEIALAKADSNATGDPDTIKLRPASSGVGAEGAQPQNVGVPAQQPAMLTCQNCGRPVAPSVALNYQGTIICPDCKQQYLQNLYAQHGTDRADYPVASFWQRFAAYLIDSIIIGIANGAIGVLIGLIIGVAIGVLGGDADASALIAQLFSFGVGIILYVFYETFFNCKFGGTPGKMILGLKVLHNGENLSVGRAVGRAFGKQLSGYICAIGYIMAAFSQDTKALHDMMCETVVVSTK
ncbi:MAG: RDD family protein [Victivallales bacterium]|nr:RDD family protein [Victivallales bacterium]